jgi:RimJ/RimL family protein N-acetyltransferase
MNTASTIETERLSMRPHDAADFADSLRMWSDPAVTRHIGGKPSSREEVWSRLLRYAGHWALVGYGYWVVRERKSGRFIGEVGFGDHKRDIVPPLDGTPELGWALMPVEHGRGYAVEAVRGALAWGDGAWNDGAVMCIIAPGNAPSLRLAAKVGFAETGRAVYKGSKTIILSRTGLFTRPAQTAS